jgi:hypothetical protein
MTITIVGKAITIVGVVITIVSVAMLPGFKAAIPVRMTSPAGRLVLFSGQMAAGQACGKFSFRSRA